MADLADCIRYLMRTSTRGCCVTQRRRIARRPHSRDPSRVPWSGRDARVSPRHCAAVLAPSRGYMSPLFDQDPCSRRRSMIRRVIEEARFVQVRSSGEGVDIPRANRAHDLEAVEALPDVRSLADGDESARSVVQLLPAYAECNPIFARSAGFEERGFE